MKSSDGSPPRGVLRSICFAITLQFIFLEFIKAHRAAEWVGNDFAAWLGALLTFAIYLAVLVCIGSILRIVLMRVFINHTIATALSAYVASLFLWALLSVQREIVPTADDALVLILLSVVTAIMASAARRGGTAFVGAIVAVSAAALIGGIGVVFVAHQTMLDAARPDKVALYAVALWTLSGAIACTAFLMPRRRTLITTIIGIAIAVGMIENRGTVVASNDQDPEPKRPNLVFIVVDTLRADILEAYGGEVVTPALSHISVQGARFNRAYTMAPWTAPSMVGMLSSSYPPALEPEGSTDRWRDQLWRYKIDETSTTLAEKLDPQGYDTFALLGNPLLTRVGARRGFRQTNLSHPITIKPIPLFSLVPFFHEALHNFFPSLPTETFNRTTRILGRKAVHWLKQRDDTPFYLWVHFIDPHVPYDPPIRFRSRSGPWPFFWPGPTHLLPDSAPTVGKGLNLTDDEKNYVKSLYMGEVQYVDEKIGAILATLKYMGLDDNTYVCIVSDHGEELWDHNGWNHGETLYNEILQVPLIIRGPGIKPQIIEEAISLVHLTPTLAELMGLESDDAWRGKSYASALLDEGAAMPNAPVFAHGTNARARPEQLQSVIAGDDKLIRGALSGTRWLYNLADDPKETINLAQNNSDLADSLETLLDDWLKSFETTFPANEGNGDPDRQRRNNAALRALGYLE